MKNKPREGCEWTDARCEQFKLLERLINSVSLLNHSTNFLGHAQDCIELADQLRKWDIDNLESSFIEFMRQQIIKDRFVEQK